MEKNVDVKEIAITVGIYLVLSSVFSFIVQKIFYDKWIVLLFGSHGNIIDFLIGLFFLIPIFAIYYLISLFALNGKNNFLISSRIILIILFIFAVSDIYGEYKSSSFEIAIGLLSNYTFLDNVRLHSDWIVKIIAFFLAFCKVNDEYKNLSNENDEKTSEKNLTIANGKLGYYICALILGFLAEQYLFFSAAVISTIVLQKKKMS